MAECINIFGVKLNAYFLSVNLSSVVVQLPTKTSSGFDKIVDHKKQIMSNRRLKCQTAGYFICIYVDSLFTIR